VSVPGHQGALGITVAHDQLGPWQIFGVEFVLTFLVVFTIFATLDPSRKSLGSDSLSIGIAYLVCSLTGIPASGASMNPARTLGPAFVMNRWKWNWVYWLGPITGGMMACLIYEFIFDTNKTIKTIREAFDELERDSNTDDDYEDPEAKISNKAMVAYSTTSGASTASSTGHRSSNHNHTTNAVAHYDHYRGITTAYTPTPTSDGVYLGTPHHNTHNSHNSHHNSHPSTNNYHHANSNYAGIYSSRTSYGNNALRTLPSRMDYTTTAITATGPGQTKF